MTIMTKVDYNSGDLFWLHRSISERVRENVQKKGIKQSGNSDIKIGLYYMNVKPDSSKSWTIACKSSNLPFTSGTKNLLTSSSNALYNK